MSVRFRGTIEEGRALGAFFELKRSALGVAARLCGFGSQPAAAGLTESQFDVLESLFHVGPLQQHDLGRRQWFSKGNMTMVLHHLEKAGLVLRRRLDHDRRYVEVRLTEAGETLLGDLLPKQAQAVQGLFTVLSADEQNELGRLCRKLHNHACQSMEARRQPTTASRRSGSREVADSALGAIYSMEPPAV